MTVEERVLRLENAFATLAEMVTKEQTRTDVLLQLVSDHDERMVTQQDWINQLGHAQAESEAKIAALADSHIRLEEAHTRLEEAHARLEEAQARTEAAITRLTERLDRHFNNGQG
ncbi:MAG: hypothetical protein AUG51_21225 [Acidobacteria bacterium 13_1_20CM_3_53_8]|nr:MAG: hypothetical protein AUG51_21225 [Acidobacteria bacterium 13_1_20CM_3_53_8]